MEPKPIKLVPPKAPFTFASEADLDSYLTMHEDLLTAVLEEGSCSGTPIGVLQNKLDEAIAIADINKDTIIDEDEWGAVEEAIDYRLSEYQQDNPCAMINALKPQIAIEAKILRVELAIEERSKIAPEAKKSDEN